MQALFRPRHDPVLAEPGAQHFGNDNGAVRFLVILQNGKDRSRDGHRGAIERVDEASPLLARSLVADVEPASLEIGAVRCARYLAELALLAAAWHPGFEIIFAIRRSAEVAGAGVDDLIRQAEALEDRLLDAQQLQVDRLALVRRAEGEHFDLGELVNAIEAPRLSPWSAGLGAETVRQADILLGKIKLVHDLVAM